MRRILSLPPEIRSYIWKYLAEGVFVKDTELTVLELDSITATLSKAQKTFVDSHFESWVVLLVSDTNNTITQEFLMENRSRVLHRCNSARSLRKFALGSVELYAPRAVPTLQVQIPLFIDRCKYKLRFWSEDSEEPHGCPQRAAGHIKWWMYAVRKLPPNVIVYVLMCQPWRDFLQLAELTAPLRARNRQIHVQAHGVHWSVLPNRELHQKLTVAAITGVDMEPLFRSVDDATARKYCRAGCTGFEREEAT